VILEGIVTTVNADGTANVSPMGPLVDEQITQFVLRPYTTSRTYRNLKRTGQGVLHVTDDVEMLARAAVHQLDPLPKLAKAKKVQGFVLADACRWYEFQVSSLDDRSERTTIACRVIAKGRIRDFFGFNRAKHAVVEASILATRIGFLPPEQIIDEFRRLAVLIDKTAGPQERRAFQFLDHYVGEALHARQTEGGA
jgi:uncharacterized protein